MALILHLSTCLNNSQETRLIVDYQNYREWINFGKFNNCKGNYDTTDVHLSIATESQNI